MSVQVFYRLGEDGCAEGLSKDFPDGVAASAWIDAMTHDPRFRLGRVQTARPPVERPARPFGVIKGGAR